MGETFTGLRMRQFDRLLRVVRERGGNGPGGAGRGAWLITITAARCGDEVDLSIRAELCPTTSGGGAELRAVIDVGLYRPALLVRAGHIGRKPYSPAPKAAKTALAHRGQEGLRLAAT